MKLVKYSTILIQFIKLLHYIMYLVQKSEVPQSISEVPYSMLGMSGLLYTYHNIILQGTI